MEGFGTLKKSPEFTRIFFDMQIEVSGIQWNHPAEWRTFQNPCIYSYLAYDIILGAWSFWNFL